MSSADDGAGHDDERLIDLDRMARPGEPPVPGAQWDELHGRWEIWDERVGSWQVIGGAADAHRSVAQTLPVFLNRELQLGDELEAEADLERVIDIDRIARPERPVLGAQWNEVVGRWELWSEAAGAWVEATSRSSAP